MDKTTTWLVRGAALVFILGGAFAFLKSAEWKGFKKNIEVSQNERNRNEYLKDTFDMQQSFCLSLYERFTPEGSPEASDEFLSKCRPLVINLWRGCGNEASKITNDLFDKRYSETFNSCALKRLKEYFQRNKQ